MPALHDRAPSLDLPETTIRLSRYGFTYPQVWGLLMRGRLVGYRDGRSWRVDTASLLKLERELAAAR